MAGTHRSQFSEAMKKNMYPWFWEAYPEEPAVYEEIAEVVPSDGAYTQFTSAIGLGDLLEKPEGEDLQADSPIESYTIVCKNRTFGRTVRFSYESIQDAYKGGNLLQSTVGSWARSLVNTKEKFYSSFINRGAYTDGSDDPFDNSITGTISDSSGDKIFDNCPWFYTAHPDKVGNTYSNFSASNSLTAANLKTVYNTFTTTNNRDERGNVISWLPDILLIHPALRFTAQEILNSSLIPTSGDNTINVLSGIVRPVTWAYITGTDDWVLMKAKVDMLATERQDIILDFFMDEYSKDYFATCLVRWGGVIRQWRGSYANNLATS
jgi:hypothetical protein